MVCAGLLTGGWTALIAKTVKTPGPLKEKLAKLAIADLQLVSVVTSGIARFYFSQLTTRSSIVLAYLVHDYPTLNSQYHEWASTFTVIHCVQMATGCSARMIFMIQYIVLAL